MRIALVGKYVQLHDAYLSVAEALKHASIHHGVELEIDWVDAEAPDLEELPRRRPTASWCPAASAGRGIEGKIRPPASPASAASRSSASASACRSR